MNMLYPKQVRKKKRKKHKPSILHQKDGTCYLCMKLNNDYRYHWILHKHHIYLAALRDISEAEGFYVWLCVKHHETDNESVHNKKDTKRILQRDCQREYEKNHTRRQFMNLIGRNYLDEKEIFPEEKDDTPGFMLLEE